MRAVGRRLSPRGSKVVGGSKRMNIMAVRWVFILEWPLILFSLGESLWDHLVRNRERKGWFCGPILRLRQIWNCLTIFSSEERKKRIQIKLTKQEGRESKVKKKGIKIKGKEYGRRPVSE